MFFFKLSMLDYYKTDIMIISLGVTCSCHYKPETVLDIKQQSLTITTDRGEFVSYLTDFSYFPLERNCQKLLDTVIAGQQYTI